MLHLLKIYNSLTREKEIFTAISHPYIGMYICGPTVYNDVHLGNCRTFICFDIIFRYLSYIGYKVKYVRNITDVGHLTNDSDEGEDKIIQKAKLEKVEPMEIVQRYTNDFHKVMNQLNNLPPNIEPFATGHIMEQIEMIKVLLEKGLAYEKDGSIYFDVRKYQENYEQNYGKLSGQILEELLTGQRQLRSQNEKRNKIDFALWKKAYPKHIMSWISPWGRGFPGWHLECSVMSTKYLGKFFDIHGGGMDLKFPHHECEIAQSHATNGSQPVNYWIHTNMLTINGQKMSKSLGNTIFPQELFSGNHSLLSRAYSPMTFRFAILQTHYSSIVDISNEALLSAARGYKKLINGLRIVKQMEYAEDENIEKSEKLNAEIEQTVEAVYEGMNDDFNTASSTGALFHLLKKINSIHNNIFSLPTLSKKSFDLMKNTYVDFTEKVFGFREEPPYSVEKAIDVILENYCIAKRNKNYSHVDLIRRQLKGMGLVLKDMKNKIDWAYKEQ